MYRSIVSLLLLFSVFGAGSVCAQVQITKVVMKAPIPGQDVSAGYFLIENLSDIDKLITGVSSVHAERIELHTHMNHDGMMHMQKLESVEVPANGSVEFAPGKHHLMIFSVGEAAINAGELELVFEFGDGETASVTAVVESWR